jgi:hypothetical protein
MDSLRKIAKTEKCDVYIVTIAALLYDNPMLEVITDEKFKKKGTGSTALRLRKRDCHKRKLL